MASPQKNYPMLIDSHAHLFLEHFKDDLDEAVRRCAEKKVEKVVLPNIDSDSVDDLIRVCRDHSNLFLPALGLHPCSVKEDWEEELSAIRKFLDEGSAHFPNQCVIAIGEIGLDYYWDLTFKEQQHAALRTQIRWAKELQLPVILHCRDSFEDLYRIVSEENDERLTGIFHCFTGTSEEANKIMELGGFMMGLGGVLTFKKSTDLRTVVSGIPLDYLLLETDAPYLTPAPFRGKRNESSYVHYVAEVLSEIKQRDIHEIGDITSKNAARMFGRNIMLSTNKND